MKTNSILYLTRKDIEYINLPMSEIIEALDKMFKEKGKAKIEMPPKIGIHTQKDAFIHAMPAYIYKLKAAGIKWISGYPTNQKKNIPYINGLLILNDTENGLPIAIMDATWITAKRTGAATAVAAKYLARKDSSSLGILACGIQGRSNLEALACLFNLKKVKAYDIYPEVAKKFAEQMKNIADIEVVSQPKDAVVDLDLVVTSGPILKNPTPVIETGWLAEGAFASPVDFDSYWKGDALRQATKLVTDDIAQMSYYRSTGYFSDTPEPYADLGEIIVGKKIGRENDNERTICINLGIALEDIVTATAIYKKAVENNIGTELSL